MYSIPALCNRFPAHNDLLFPELQLPMTEKLAAKLTPYFDSLFHCSEPEIRILSIGCGMSYELLALMNYLHEHQISKPVYFLGIDIDPQAIVKVQQRFFANSGLPNLHINFEVRDANDPLSYSPMDGKGFAGVIVRHPRMRGDLNIAHEQQEALAMQRIIHEQVPRFLTTGTEVFLSFYHQHELETFQGLLPVAAIPSHQVCIIKHEDNFNYGSYISRGANLAFDQFTVHIK